MRQSYNRLFLALVTITILTSATTIKPVRAQAPRTISHQGLLTDNVGDPVADATYTADFSIYDQDAGGSSLWTQSLKISTVDGIFHAEVGPITGVDFGQPLWLGVKVESDPEMVPRAPLTSVPSTFALVLPFMAVADTSQPAFRMENEGSGDAILAFNRGSGTAGAFIVSDPTGMNENTGVFGQTDAIGAAVFGENIGMGHAGRFITSMPSNPSPAVFVQSLDLETDLTESSNEDLTIHAADAQIGLYSNASGLVGSGIQLGEILAGSLTNKWSLFRGTTADGAPLKISFGTQSGYADNTTMVEIDSSGNMTAASLEYTEPRTHYASINGAAFRPNSVGATTAWTSLNGAAYVTAGGGLGKMSAPVSLPDGAVLKEFTCVMDDNAAVDLECSLDSAVILGGGTSFGVGNETSVSSSGTPGHTIESTTVFSSGTINNETRSYVVTAKPSSGAWSTVGDDLVIKQVVIEYELTEAQ